MCRKTFESGNIRIGSNNFLQYSVAVKRLICRLIIKAFVFKTNSFPYFNFFIKE